MGGAGHAVACVAQAGEVLELALHVVQPLDRQQAAGHLLACGPIRQKRIQILGGADDAQPPIRLFRKAIEFPGMEQRAVQQRIPRACRLQLGNGKEGDVVAVAAVAVVVEAARRLGNGGEHLKRHIACLKTREINVAALVGLQEIALPQQRVAMQINDGQAFVQGQRFRAGGRRRVRHQRVDMPIVPRGKHGEEADHGQHNGDENGTAPVHALLLCLRA